MSTLFFIRHGMASFGKDNYDELSETGRRQSILLARYFEEMNRRFDVVYTGTLQRHLKTADELLSLLEEQEIAPPEIHRLEWLNEYPTQEIFRALAPFAIQENPSLAAEVGRLMTDRRAFQKVFEAIMSLWGSGKYDVPGLMTWKEYSEKVNRSIDEIMKANGTGKNVAVYTSGGTISVAVQRTLCLSNDAAMKVAEQLVNTSVSRFKCTRDRIMLFTFNEFPHLEREQDEKLITYR